MVAATATPSVDAGAGSGLSDGAFVTLGYREARDVRCVLEWLSKRKDVSALALWGQSMGAAAAPYCVEIKISRRVRAESSRRPPRHRRDACSMA